MLHTPPVYDIIESMHALPPDVPSFIRALAPIVDHYGYFAVAGLVLIEDFGVPAPGETVLISAAFFAGLGQLNILLVVLAGFFGAVIGDNIGFAIGEYGGHPLINRFGKYIFLTPPRVERAENFFNRHGGKVVVIARFVEGLRQANGIIAGLSEMKWLKFITFNSIGAFLWVSVWSAVGYFGGSHIKAFMKYELYFSSVVIVALIVFILYKIIKKRKSIAD